MQKVNQLTVLTNHLTKNGFEIKVLLKNKTIMVLKKGFPRIHIEVLKKGFKISSKKELLDKALLNNEGILEYVNQINQKTTLCKYYLEKGNSIVAETTILQTIEENAMKNLIQILKHDLKLVLKENKNSRRFITV